MMHFMDDRFTRGLVAGTLAGIVGIAWNLFSYYVLHLATLRWGDFAAFLIIKNKITNIWELIAAELVTLFFTAFLGMLFCYLVPLINSKRVWLKGLVYGLLTWFFLFAITSLFKVPELLTLPARTSLVHAVSGIIWGLSLAFFFNWMDRRLQH